MPSIFPFVEKEGKFFAPIVSNEPRYRISPDQDNPGSGATRTRDGIFVEPDTAQPMTEKSGTKGTYAIVRMVLPAGDSVEVPATPETLTFSGVDVSPCWVQYVTPTWARVPDDQAALLQFTPVGYWRGSVAARPLVITPTAGIPVWTANVFGVDNYIFYIETDVVTTNGFALGQPGLSIAHSATGFISRDITERILWTPSCDLIGPNALTGTITMPTEMRTVVQPGLAQSKSEMFATNSQTFLSSN